MASGRIDPWIGSAVDLYFAYGSNLSTSRMRGRVCSAEVIGRAQLLNHQLTFDKRGRDGSGKANVTSMERASTWGVLYRIEASSFSRLDGFESGYRRIRVEVALTSGETRNADTYRAIAAASGLLPYSWYKKLITDGARAHDLPEEYVAFLDSIPAIPA